MKVYVVIMNWAWDFKQEIKAFPTIEKAEQFLREVLTNHSYFKKTKSVLRDNEVIVTVDWVIQTILKEKLFINDWDIKNKVYPFRIELLEREVQ